MPSGNFSCEKCRKSYKWKPEYAGRSLKCACGYVMTAPPQAIEPPELGDDLYKMTEVAEQTRPMRRASEVTCPSCSATLVSTAVLCVGCGYNLKTGGKVRSAVGAAVGGGGKGVLGYQPGRTAAQRQRGGETAIEGDPFKDLYLPCGLVLVGAGLGFWHFSHNWRLSLGQASVALTIRLLVDMSLIFVGCLIAIKAMDIAIGAPMQAIIKIAAIAVAPGALIVLAELFPGGKYVGWALGALLCYILFMVFFDLDLGEVLMLSCIIWVIQTWVGILVVMMILGAIGINLPVASGVGASIAMTPSLGGGEAANKPPPPPPEWLLHERDAAGLRSIDDSQEARGWFELDKRYSFLKLGRAGGETLVNEFYALGAERMTVSAMEKSADEAQVAHYVVIDLPPDPAKRKMLFDLRNKYARELGGRALPESEQKYLVLWFDLTMEPTEKEIKERQKAAVGEIDQ